LDVQLHTLITLAKLQNVAKKIQKSGLERQQMMARCSYLFRTYGLEWDGQMDERTAPFS